MAENVSNQFSGLPMDSLIGAPLLAACEAQLKLANATANFIQTVGFENGNIRNVDFRYKKQIPQYNEQGELTNYEMKDMIITTPLISIVKIPSLSISDLNITFDMEVKSSEEEKSSSDKTGSIDAEASCGFASFKAKVSVKGSISSHKENTRKTDTSAKYHVELNARDEGASEGLLRVLDIMQSAIAPAEKDKISSQS